MKLTEAIPIALTGIAELYGDSVDRNGIPKVLHPLEVADYHKGDGLLFLISLLHDVIEDFGDRGRALVAKMDGGPELDRVLDLLSRRDGEPYDDYIERIAESKDKNALMVKLTDLKVNFERSQKYKAEDLVKRYEKAGKRLTKVMVKLMLSQLTEELFADDEPPVEGKVELMAGDTKLAEIDLNKRILH